MAVSYLLLLRFVLYVPITIVGFVVLVTRYGGWSRMRAVEPCRLSETARPSRRAELAPDPRLTCAPKARPRASR